MSRQAAMEAAATMPPLLHRPEGDEGGDFDYTQSEVMKWLMQQREIMDWVFVSIKNRGAIKFDPATRTWRGIGVGALNAKGEERAGKISAALTGRRLSRSTEFRSPWTEERVMDALRSEPGFKESGHEWPTASLVFLLEDKLSMHERTAYTWISRLRASGQLPKVAAKPEPAEAPVEL